MNANLSDCLHTELLNYIRYYYIREDGLYHFSTSVRMDCTTSHDLYLQSPLPSTMNPYSHYHHTHIPTFTLLEFHPSKPNPSPNKPRPSSSKAQTLSTQFISKMCTSFISPGSTISTPYDHRDYLIPKPRLLAPK